MVPATEFVVQNMGQTFNLNRDTMLVTAPDYRVEAAAGGVRIHINGQSFRADSNLLLLLHAFSVPKPLFQGIHGVASICKGSTDWMRLLELARRVAEKGLLVEPRASDLALESDSGSFAAAEIHIRMLADHARTSWYQRALRSNVGPEDVVVEIGTGSGVLAASAAKAGARHVYAIERVPSTARLAREFFAENGITNVTVLEGDSTRIDLPENGTLLMSEIIGNDPLAEGVIPSVRDALDRLLKPNAKLIPNWIRIGATLFQLDPHIYDRFFVSDVMRHDWKEWYGLDFRVFQRACEARNAVWQVGSQHFAQWLRLTPAIELLEIDFANLPTEGLKASAACNVSCDGLINAVLIHFDLSAPNVADFSTRPDSVSRANSWANACIILREPLSVVSGDAIELHYAFAGRKSEVQVFRRSR